MNQYKRLYFPKSIGALLVFLSLLRVENAKMKRSIVLHILLIVFAFVPIMMGGMMFVAMHPEIAENMGILSAKASLFPEISWYGFLSMTNQLISVLGLIAFGFVTSWVFGREFVLGTFSGNLSIPINRGAIVMTKYGYIFMICFVLSIELLAVSMLMGKLLSLPEANSLVIINMLVHYLTATVMMILLSSITSYIACVSRGILAPIGFIIGIVILSQFIALLGLGAYFPWTIPALVAMNIPAEGMTPNSASWIVFTIAVIAGWVATVQWWQKADHF